MNIQNEKINTKLLYSVGYVPEVDKYILSCVVTWVAWYNRYYEITKEEYEAFGTERLDQLAVFGNWNVNQIDFYFRIGMKKIQRSRMH